MGPCRCFVMNGVPAVTLRGTKQTNRYGRRNHDRQVSCPTYVMRKGHQEPWGPCASLMIVSWISTSLSSHEASRTGSPATILASGARIAVFSFRLCITRPKRSSCALSRVTPITCKLQLNLNRGRTVGGRVASRRRHLPRQV
jgi:hypothetical protein